MRPFQGHRKDNAANEDTSNQKNRVPTARPRAAKLSPDLAEVMDAWTELPEAIKAGILAMIKASRR
jgi:hypothetical protein